MWSSLLKIWCRERRLIFENLITIGITYHFIHNSSSLHWKILIFWRKVWWEELALMSHLCKQPFARASYVKKFHPKTSTVSGTTLVWKSCLSLQHYAIVSMPFVYSHDGQNKSGFWKTSWCVNRRLQICSILLTIHQDITRWLSIIGRRHHRYHRVENFVLNHGSRKWPKYFGKYIAWSFYVMVFKITGNNNACKYWNVKFEMSLCMARGNKRLKSIFSQFPTTVFVWAILNN